MHVYFANASEYVLSAVRNVKMAAVKSKARSFNWGEGQIKW